MLCCAAAVRTAAVAVLLLLPLRAVTAAVVVVHCGDAVVVYGAVRRSLTSGVWSCSRWWCHGGPDAFCLS